MSPTQLSLRLLRDMGGVVEVVERWNSFSKTRKDLWGWADILVLRPDVSEIVAVQTTTKSNMNARIKKIRESSTLETVLACGILVEVHGWYKEGGKWKVRIENLS